MQKSFLFILFFGAIVAYGQSSKPITSPHRPTLTANNPSQPPLEEQIAQLEAKKISLSKTYAPESPEMKKVDLLLEQKKRLLKQKNDRTRK